MIETKKKLLNRENAQIASNLPIKIIQFGEGNFLRAFVDFIIDKLNEQANFNAGVAIVQPIDRGLVQMLNDQDGLYHLFMKGVQKGNEIQEHRLISCIQKSINPYEDYEEYLKLAELDSLKFVISNTTEAGITFDEDDRLETVPHNSFPAKLTTFLYRRFSHFSGDTAKGLTIIPCELINYNADQLKKIILQYAELWNLPDDFAKWVNEHNSFHNSLVDRIVPGYPKDDIDAYLEQIPFHDNLVVSAEKFLLWVIEESEGFQHKIPFTKIEENVMVVDSLQPYRTRKVRILNGAHTTMVPFSLLYGNETVKQTIDNEFTGKFVNDVLLEEIIPTLTLPEDELKEFAEDVLDRFRNPFIKHQLSSIALNSVSKFKVRVLPSLLAYVEERSEIPPRLTFALASLLRFYGNEWNGNQLPVNDGGDILEKMDSIWALNDYDQIVSEFLGEEKFWDQDLTQVPRLQDNVVRALKNIENLGIEKGFQSFLSEIQS